MEHQLEKQHGKGATDWLAGGGEMGKLVRSIDWSNTALGPIESWPQSLRTTISLCLASNFPISIAWGPNRVQIYNDGYWPICAAKHPFSMGQDFKECWFSAWPVIGEAFERAAAGETTFLVDRRLFVDRKGYLEEAFFTFSFSPIRDETGNVAGLFHPVIELTQQSLAERRLKILRDLANATTDAKTVAEACSLMAQVFAGCGLDLPFVLIYLLDTRCEQARLAASTGLVSGTVACREAIDLKLEKQPSWPLAQVARSALAAQVDNLEERFGSLGCGPYPESPKTAFVLPIISPALEHPLGVLVAAVSPRRELDEPYRTFYGMLADAVTNAIANARAYEEQRKRADALAELDRAKTVFFSNVSHEFRTPLTLMLGPVEDLLAKSPTDLSASAKGQLEIVNRNGLRLLRLVNTLLDFSRIEAGRVQASYVATDLATFTAELASCFRAAVERAGLRLTIDCPPLPEPVYVDRDMWEKIVLNLISNAFKFTFEGEIAVSLRMSGEWRVESGAKGEPPDDRAELSRAQSVAGGDELSGTVLFCDEGLSQRGTIRPDESDSPRRSVGSSEHRRGTGETVHEGVPQLSQHRSRIADGIGDTSAAQSARGTAQSRAAESDASDGGGNQSNAFGAPTRAEREVKTGEWIVESDYPLTTIRSPLSKSLLITHHSPLTSRHVTLTVRDTGVGIAAEDMPRIFERFHRVENMRSRTHEGTGIGLALVQELVKLHAGSVRAESKIGAGSAFIVTVPLGTAHLPADRIGAGRNVASTALGAAPFVEEALRWLPGEGESDIIDRVPARHELAPALFSPSPGEQKAHRARILVADDNADMRQYIARLLSERYAVETVSDGEAALAAVREHRPDLILSDMMMPRLDGFGLLRAVRDDPKTRTIPVIMLSARAGEESRVEGLEHGADDYLIKPFSARELGARVAAHLQLRRVQREAEQTLRQRTEQFETLLNEAPLGVYLVDAEFRIRQVNPTAMPLFGNIPDLIGRDFDEVIHILWPKAYAGEIVRLFRHTLETGESYTTAERIEERLDRGATEYYEWQINRIALPEGRYGVVCYFRDISAQVFARQKITESEERFRLLNVNLEERVSERTAELRGMIVERERLQEQLLQAQKMESVGTLASGVAHDFNNLLNIIASYAAIMRLGGKNPATVSEGAAIIEETVRRGATLVQQLMALGRKREIKFAPVGINGVVEKLAGLLNETFSKTVVITLELERGLPNINGDENQLHQTLLNLCVNARDAMPEGGRISLKTETVSGEELRSRIAEAEAQRYASISVSDSGSGMDEATRRRIFEPFFTTKPIGQGTGLGLAVAYGIVKNHWGFIDVESEAGRGTTFRIYLPITNKAAEQASEIAANGTALEPTGHGETILFVDDEEQQLKAMQRFLESEGYKVLGAKDGREAVETFKRHKDEIAIAVLDLGLPKLGGWQAFQEMREVRPELKVLVASGFVSAELEAEIAQGKLGEIIEKPYRLDDVLEKISQAIHGG